MASATKARNSANRNHDLFVERELGRHVAASGLVTGRAGDVGVMVVPAGDF
jgi:hypothetical protein